VAIGRLSLGDGAIGDSVEGRGDRSLGGGAIANSRELSVLFTTV
jgi:hypothetical protein